MSWRIYIRGKAKKQLKRLPTGYFKLLERTIDDMRLHPYVGDTKKMEGAENVWRRRVGAYRVEFEVYEKEKLIYIFEIRRRTTSTY